MLTSVRWPSQEACTMKSSSSTTGPTTSRKCWAQLRNSRTVCRARSVTRCVSVHSAMKACPSWRSELPLFRISLRPKQSHRFLRPMTSARQTQMWKRSLRRQDEFILDLGPGKGEFCALPTSFTRSHVCCYSPATSGSPRDCRQHPRGGALP